MNYVRGTRWFVRVRIAELVTIQTPHIGTGSKGMTVLRGIGDTNEEAWRYALGAALGPYDYEEDSVDIKLPGVSELGDAEPLDDPHLLGDYLDNHPGAELGVSTNKDGSLDFDLRNNADSDDPDFDTAEIAAQMTMDLDDPDAGRFILSAQERGQLLIMQGDLDTPELIAYAKSFTDPADDPKNCWGNGTWAEGDWTQARKKYGPTGGTKPLGTREEERLVEAIDEMKVQGLDHPRRNPDGSNTYHVSFQRPDGREFHTEFTSGPLSDPRNVKPTDVLGYNAEFAETWDGYLSQEKDYDYAGFDAEEMGEVELAIKYATHENRLKGNAERLREFLGDSLYESAKEYSVDGGMLSTRLIP